MGDYTSQEIKQLRKKILDYYGSASPFFPLATADVARVENMSDDEIIREAKKLGFC